MSETILLNKYLIIKELKANINSMTYLVSDLETNEKYVIKQSSLFKQNLRVLDILKNEARTLKNLQHSQIPKFIDFKVIDDEYKSNVYLIQEYINGYNLVELIEDGKRFNENEVIDIIRQLISILDYLHCMSPPIIHQDIKPGNIIMTPDDKIYLVDFGAVNEKSIFTNNSGLSTIIGTQGYMPIEQFEGKVKPASDIYSLGLTAIYLLSQHEPLQIDKEGLQFDFRKYVNISDRFYKILAKMVEPDWKKRFQSAENLEISLNEIGKDISLNKKINSLISEDITEKIIPNLRKDETILWSSRPNWKRNLIISTLGIYTFGIPWTAFSLFWTAMASTAVLKSIFLIVFPMFGLPFIAIGFGMLSMPYFFYSEMKGTIYTITDKRLMVIVTNENTYSKWLISLAKIFKYSPVKQLKSFNFSELKKMRMEKKVYSNGTGDIKFLVRDKEGDETRPLELIGISDVDRVEKLIGELFSL